MIEKFQDAQISNTIEILDKKLSQRFIELDPKGYFLIKLDQKSNEIILEHYSNDIDEQGRAINPETGKPIQCRGELKRQPLSIYKGKSAKELGIQITEEITLAPISKIDHALYLGRELQKAEECLKENRSYIQD
tara:strand:+ start:7504 stop:7905 length:402 start_codon:yes stop_codon:yes gene_type:complete